MAHTRQGDAQSVGQLVAAASRDMSALVRAEIALAKMEAKQEAKTAALGGAMLGAAGVVAMLGVILLCIAAAYGLVAAGLHPGWAFLIVAAVFLLTGAALGLVGVKRMRTVGPPERTIRTVKESIAAITHPRANGSSRPATVDLTTTASSPALPAGKRGAAATT